MQSFMKNIYCFNNLYPFQNSLRYLLAALTISQVCFCADILILLPTAVPSHINTFKFLIRALSEEHNVIFYGMPLKLNNKNVTEKYIEMNMDSYLGDLRYAILHLIF